MLCFNKDGAAFSAMRKLAGPYVRSANTQGIGNTSRYLRFSPRKTSPLNGNKVSFRSGYLVKSRKIQERKCVLVSLHCCTRAQASAVLSTLSSSDPYDNSKLSEQVVYICQVCFSFNHLVTKLRKIQRKSYHENHVLNFLNTEH